MSVIVGVYWPPTTDVQRSYANENFKYYTITMKKMWGGGQDIVHIFWAEGVLFFLFFYCFICNGPLWWDVAERMRFDCEHWLRSVLGSGKPSGGSWNRIIWKKKQDSSIFQGF